MKTNQYWSNRANARMDKYLLSAEQTADEIENAYKRAEFYLRNEMKSVYNGLSKISNDDVATLSLTFPPNKSAVDIIKKNISKMSQDEKQEALTLLSSPAYKARITRLQTTLDNCRQQCNKLYKTQLQTTHDFLSDLSNTAYYRAAYDTAKGTGIAVNFALFPQQRIESILKYRWSGTHYSQRIWNNSQKLVNELKSTLITGFMTGKSVQKMTAEITRRFAVNEYRARCLIRTEACYVANAAEMQSYKDCGIDKYEYVATLDSRTSTLCQALDGKIFDISDAQPGVNMPPMHPHCRSTTIAHNPDDIPVNRIAKDENGKNITVPYSMKYAEWKEKFVKEEDE